MFKFTNNETVLEGIDLKDQSVKIKIKDVRSVSINPVYVFDPSKAFGPSPSPIDYYNVEYEEAV